MRSKVNLIYSEKALGSTTKSDHPAYSCEKAPWAFVSGVEPLNLYYSCFVLVKELPLDPAGTGVGLGSLNT